MAGAEGTVLGHYVATTTGGLLGKAVGSWSTPLFNSVTQDDLRALEQLVAADAPIDEEYLILCWGSEPSSQQDVIDKDQAEARPQVQVSKRTLLDLACFHGSLRCVSLILARGVNPGQKSSDGLTPYDFASTSSDPNAPTVKAMLDDAAGNFTAEGRGRLQAGISGARADAAAGMMRAGSSGSMAVGADTGAGDDECFPPGEAPTYSTADLTRPEYATDTFRMFCFKVLRCSKRYAHDWRACPFAHQTENARRRDPQEVQYSSIACPDYKQGMCLRGDTCQYAHGVFEAWLHPSRYRTQLCKDGSRCRRPVCFFAHSLTGELRTPTHTFVPGPEERMRVPQAIELQMAAAAAAARSSTAIGADAAADAASGDQDFDGASAAAAAAAAAATAYVQAHGGGGAAGSADGGAAAKARLEQGAAAAAAAAAGSSLSALLRGSAPLRAPGSDAPGGAGADQRQHQAPAAAAGELRRAPGGVEAGGGAAAADTRGTSGAGQGGPRSPLSLSAQAGAPTPSTGGPGGATGGAAAAAAASLASAPNVTVPRMSNAFLRRYGLNPKDAPLVNLQKIMEIHSQNPQQALAALRAESGGSRSQGQGGAGGAGGGGGGGSSRPPRQRGAGRQHQQQRRAPHQLPHQQHQCLPPQQAQHAQHAQHAYPQQYAYSQPQFPPYPQAGPEQHQPRRHNQAAPPGAPPHAPEPALAPMHHAQQLQLQSQVSHALGYGLAPAQQLRPLEFGALSGAPSAPHAQLLQPPLGAPPAVVGGGGGSGFYGAPGAAAAPLLAPHHAVHDPHVLAMLIGGLGIGGPGGEAGGQGLAGGQGAEVQFQGMQFQGMQYHPQPVFLHQGAPPLGPVAGMVPGTFGAPGGTGPPIGPSIGLLQVRGGLGEQQDGVRGPQHY